MESAAKIKCKIKSKLVFAAVLFASNTHAYRPPPTFNCIHPNNIVLHNSLNSELLRSNSALLGIEKSRRLNFENLDTPTFLQKTGLISKVEAGIYALLPLGTRIVKRICDVISREMGHLGCMQVTLPLLQPLNRIKTGFSRFHDVSLSLKDRREREFVLSPTSEEAICMLLADQLLPISENSLPIAVYQIGRKFRDEFRFSDLDVRLREFTMKDAYSLHASSACANETFNNFVEAYKRIFDTLKLPYSIKELDQGLSCEFIVTLKNGHELEMAHAFKLGTEYPQNCKLFFERDSRVQYPLYLNSYGIGIERVLYALADTHRDSGGLCMPSVVAPYDFAIISANPDSADVLNALLTWLGADVLVDNRKLSVSTRTWDLRACGIPHIFKASHDLDDDKNDMTSESLPKPLRDTIVSLWSRLSMTPNLAEFTSKLSKCSFDYYDRDAKAYLGVFGQNLCNV